MGKILDRDDVEDTRNWQCRDGNDLSDDRLNDLCDSHEALRDLLREVLIEWRNGRACGCERCKDLIARASDAVDAALEVGKP